MTSKNIGLTKLIISALLVATLSLGWSAVRADIVVSVEEPAINAVMSGVSNLRGWAISPAGIERVELHIDGKFVTTVPMGGARRDVGASYPSYPGADKAGFSMAFNYSSLATGTHQLLIRAIDRTGGSQEVLREFTVTRVHADFINQAASLATATATITSASTIRLSGVALDRLQYDLTLDWTPGAQGFKITSVAPAGGGIRNSLWAGAGAQNPIENMIPPPSASPVPRSPDLGLPQKTLQKAESSEGAGPRIHIANAANKNESIQLKIEEPLSFKGTSGVSNLRGWAVAPSGIAAIQLYVDGEYKTDIPSGGLRGDVGDAFPSYPGSRNSGYSMAFNYSDLSDSHHVVTVRAIDRVGNWNEQTTLFRTTRFTRPFIGNPASASLSEARARIAGDSLLVERFRINSEYFNLALEWDIPSQNFRMISIEPVNVMTTVLRDTSPDSFLSQVIGIGTGLVGLFGEKDSRGNLTIPQGLLISRDKNDWSFIKTTSDGTPEYIETSAGFRVVFSNYTGTHADIAVYDQQNGFLTQLRVSLQGHGLDIARHGPRSIAAWSLSDWTTAALAVECGVGWALLVIPEPTSITSVAGAYLIKDGCGSLLKKSLIEILDLPEEVATISTIYSCYEGQIGGCVTGAINAIDYYQIENGQAIPNWRSVWTVTNTVDIDLYWGRTGCSGISAISTYDHTRGTAIGSRILWDEEKCFVGPLGEVPTGTGTLDDGTPFPNNPSLVDLQYFYSYSAGDLDVSVEIVSRNRYRVIYAWPGDHVWKIIWDFRRAWPSQYVLELNAH